MLEDDSKLVETFNYNQVVDAVKERYGELEVNNAGVQQAFVKWAINLFVLIGSSYGNVCSRQC